MSERRDTSWHLLKIVVALVLIAAAVTKATNVAQILASDGLLSSRWLLMAAIGFESAVAIYLLIAPAYWSWTATLVTFAGFSLIAAYALVTQQDCNCFGDRLGPRVTLPLDLIVLAAAFWFRPQPQSRARSAFPPGALGAVAVGALMVGLASTNHARQIRPDTSSSSIDLLLADSYVGKPWPIKEAFHPGLAELQNGNWLILVVRADCDHCREMLDLYFSDPSTHRANERTAIFVAGSDTWPFRFDHVSLPISDDQVVRWKTEEPFVASPAAFLVSDGVVVEAADGQDSDEFMAGIMKQ